MKTPLNYQLGDFDCVPTSFSNGLVYLLGRSEYLPDFIRAISQNTIDVSAQRLITDQGSTAKGKGSREINEVGLGGTSTESAQNLCQILDNYKSDKWDPITCRFFTNQEVTKDALKAAVKKKSVALMNIHLGGEGHYVLVTDVDRKYAYMFDPYYQKMGSIKLPTVQMDERHPFKYNRKVALDHLFTDDTRDYTLRKEPYREMVVLRRDTKRR